MQQFSDSVCVCLLCPSLIVCLFTLRARWAADVVANCEEAFPRWPQLFLRFLNKPTVVHPQHVALPLVEEKCVSVCFSQRIDS